MAAIAVRRARPEDSEAMAAIMAEVAKEGFLGAEPPVDVAERAERFREALLGPEPDAAMWVLDEAGAVVGHAGVRSRVSGVHSFGMAILPEARGRGGGRALLEAIVEHARASGAHKVDLEVWVDNARAIALYVSAGFEVEGVRRDHYRRRDGRLRSTLIMSRRLDAG
ncbi:MAG: GNAT family N-acetyltransferase [Solirubrobacterales bacterium]|nr:GNAT family N-acetyltransferase [Solirubrobacterales bacterium]MBV9715195.1 GNAT family N-acetyltransferase [Solirubrobacterales bacterium]